MTHTICWFSESLLHESIYTYDVKIILIFILSSAQIIFNIWQPLKSSETLCSLSWNRRDASVFGRNKNVQTGREERQTRSTVGKRAGGLNALKSH